MNLTLDTGALISLERGHEAVTDLPAAVARSGGEISIPLASWPRRGAHRVRYVSQAAATPSVGVVPLDGRAARGFGQLLAASGTSDAIDAHVVLVAGLSDAVLTNDPDDLRRLDPRSSCASSDR